MPSSITGGSVVVSTQSVTLNNAEFKALPSTPIEIIPAPGTGKIIRWLGAWMVLNNEAGIYNPIDSGAILQLVYMTAPFPIEASSFVPIAAAAAVQGVHSAPIPPLAGFNQSEGYLTWAPTDTGTLIQNAALGIADIYNGVDDYTGGDDANTLQVNAIYTIVDA